MVSVTGLHCTRIILWSMQIHNLYVRVTYKRNTIKGVTHIRKDYNRKAIDEKQG